MDKGRHEYKFQIDEKDILLLSARIGQLMQKDRHVSAKGYYHIRSVYFDDYMDTCYMKNEAGTDPRAKYRMRIYDCKDEIIKLEKKVKERGMTRKYSASVSREQANLLLQGKCLSMKQADFEAYPLLLRQFLLLMQMRQMRPKVIVSYDRVPYVEPRGNVRVTFDKNISTSRDFSHFFEPAMLKMPILPAGVHLMEVKYDAFLPAVIKENLELGHLRAETFSKYYLCRKKWYKN